MSTCFLRRSHQQRPRAEEFPNPHSRSPIQKQMGHRLPSSLVVLRLVLVPLLLLLVDALAHTRSHLRRMRRSLAMRSRALEQAPFEEKLSSFGSSTEWFSHLMSDERSRERASDAPRVSMRVIVTRARSVVRSNIFKCVRDQLRSHARTHATLD
jgi:hypothetical protein